MSASRSQVKHPRWLPRALRPTPRVLAQARAFTAKTFGDRWAEALAVDGFLHPDEASMLCHLAHEAPPGAILEIGSYHGKSAVFIGTGMGETHTLTAVDPQVHAKGLKEVGETDPEGPGGEHWEINQATLAAWDLTGRVESVRRYSYNLRPEWTRPLSMLWIDGHHGYDAVRRDIADWAGLVVPGGYLAFHDVHESHEESHGWGVRRAVLDADLGAQGFRTLIELRNAWFFRRV